MSTKSLFKDLIQSLVANETHSALSLKVRHLLCEVGMQSNLSTNDNIANENECGSKSAVCCHGFIEFSHCAGILPDNAELSVEEYYVRSVAAIAETFRHSQEILECLSSQEFSKTYGEYLLWTKHPEIFQECFELLTHKDGADDHLSLLLLCAGLERALGNLFLLRGQQCPKMLKELLAAKELEDILGCAAIKVLQIVIGPPMSLNIRNVSWHGFLSEDELPRRYIFFLLLVTASLGKVLENQGINSEHIITKDYVSLTKAEEISRNLGVPELSTAEVQSLEECVVKSWLIGEGNINFFKGAVANYKHQRFGSCAVLLLPLLEHALRNIFVVVNNCPDRLVTAEASTLYTTFEEILDVSLADGRENVLVQILGEPCMTHRREILDCLDNYHSVFHPVMMLHQKILQLCTLAAHLHDDLVTSTELDPWNSADGYDMFLVKNSAFTSMKETFTDILDGVAMSFPTLSVPEWQLVKLGLLVPFCCVHQDVRSLLPLRLKTLYRWQKDLCAASSKNDYGDSADSADGYSKEKSSCPASLKVGENEIVGILSRIITETEKTLTQTKSALQLRQEQLVSKQLRSRQRDNLKRLLTLFLKNTLRTCENLRTLTSGDANKWSEAGQTSISELKSALKFSHLNIFSCAPVAEAVTESKLMTPTVARK